MDMSAFEAIVFLVGLYASQAAVCPADWRQYGDICYFPITTSMSWEEANQACFAKEAQLALPRSQMEQDAIWGMLQETVNGQFPERIWIACSDFEEEGNWRPCPLRDDGSNAYENWRGNQPDNNNGADCAAMIRSNGGRWGDRPCRELNFAVCQLPAILMSVPTVCLLINTDGRPASACLVGHNLKEIPVTGVVECGMACRLEPRCRSFNLVKQGRAGMLCQLKNVTWSEADEKSFMKTQENCYFFEL
ncbi:echinoidin-like [Acanthaster planci]|uniref:Echinoidin-like n=1 Tax=Acanthaster planci TaxID=133434 RepID=A0A8B7YWA6_ACAPL|nr:echinoidin-like [Acanthaster planci]